MVHQLCYHYSNSHLWFFPLLNRNSWAFLHSLISHNGLIINTTVFRSVYRTDLRQGMCSPIVHVPAVNHFCVLLQWRTLAVTDNCSWPFPRRAIKCLSFGDVWQVHYHPDGMSIKVSSRGNFSDRRAPADAWNRYTWTALSFGPMPVPPPRGAVKIFPPFIYSSPEIRGWFFFHYSYQFLNACFLISFFAPPPLLPTLPPLSREHSINPSVIIIRNQALYQSFLSTSRLSNMLIRLFFNLIVRNYRMISAFFFQFSGSDLIFFSCLRFLSYSSNSFCKGRSGDYSVWLSSFFTFFLKGLYCSVCKQWIFPVQKRNFPRFSYTLIVFPGSERICFVICRIFPSVWIGQSRHGSRSGSLIWSLDATRISFVMFIYVHGLIPHYFWQCTGRSPSPRVRCSSGGRSKH